MSGKQVVLITGCSDGGLGSALALAFHATGKYRVIATARNLAKLTATRAKGIEEIQLDVLSNDSIAACIERLDALTGGRLDMLVNNAGAGYNMPALDADIDQAKKVFDLNVWSQITVSKAFIPMLLKSQDAKIVNNISVAAYVTVPVQGVYSASKAAANSLTETMRIELKPFGIKVVALMTGAVKSNFYGSANFDQETSVLPEDSIYRVVPNGLSMMKGHGNTNMEAAMMADKWAQGVVSDLSTTRPPHQIWRGGSARFIRFGSLMPIGTFDRQLMQFSKFDEVEHALKSSKEISR